MVDVVVVEPGTVVDGPTGTVVVVSGTVVDVEVVVLSPVVVVVESSGTVTPISDLGSEKPWTIGDAAALISCDNCGHTVFEEDVEYRKDEEEGITWILCDECVELYDDWLQAARNGEQERFSFLGMSCCWCLPVRDVRFILIR